MSTGKKIMVGVVLSNKMDKSLVVQCERIIRHKLYGKYIRRHIKYMVDDPQERCSIGDSVLIEECRPLSKRKRWRVRDIVEKAV
ncbi:MAG: 30S ribosomal protein S17 [Thermodesulfobacteriota bacterium]|nr:30S ribosomal protein S17 [Thermodesulfobacteriota bacterium]